MEKLDLDKQESEFLSRAIKHWEREGFIDSLVADTLRSSYDVKGFDWMRLAKYSFWIALICGGISFGWFIIDDAFLNYIKKLYDTPNIVISILSGIVSASLFLWGRRLKRISPEKVFSNEAVTFMAVLFTALCIAYLGKTFDNGSGHYSILFLVSVFVYGVLAWNMDSRLIWLFALVSLGSWFGSETGYQTHWGYYFLGMNYPLRFVLFGIVIVTAGATLKRQTWFKHFADITYIAGLLYLFMSLWFLSIVGNYANFDQWWPVKQITLFYWGIIAAIFFVGFLLYGLKNNDVIAREFGITFLIILIYTKYFEYFWSNTNKPLFFAILAISFWFIGRKAEKIWNVSTAKRKK
ncbi:DUF2157 domain-containing protein [Mucilaginibacter paludis]|uniref:DUF2157 domain-containing protein n=1 Tax=Mucilaginibacter paludis DSM 18603 TaxID=714943 RepID=H1YFX1_9SPHI|nr:DUF2157 domain-containing protein [Mucilaginibacter paludis]EHQ25362.1 hypothetical protein Mucpa_1197 [Mucilaginibacter paludis DSM 18603]